MDPGMSLANPNTGTRIAIAGPGHAPLLRGAIFLALALSACFLAGNARIEAITSSPDRTVSLLARAKDMSRHEIRAGDAIVTITCEFRDGGLAEATAVGSPLDGFGHGAAAQFCETLNAPA